MTLAVIGYQWRNLCAMLVQIVTKCNGLMYLAWLLLSEFHPQKRPPKRSLYPIAWSHLLTCWHGKITTLSNNRDRKMCQFGDAIYQAAIQTESEFSFDYDESGLFALLTKGSNWVRIHSTSHNAQAEIDRWISVYSPRFC